MAGGEGDIRVWVEHCDHAGGLELAGEANADGSTGCVRFFEEFDAVPCGDSLPSQSRLNEIVGEQYLSGKLVAAGFLERLRISMTNDGSSEVDVGPLEVVAEFVKQGELLPPP